MRSKRMLAIGAFLVLGFAARLGAQDKLPLNLVATTPLPGYSGDFDHFGIDLKGRRLFLAAEDHKTVEVFDLDGKWLTSITGFGQPHAIRYLPEPNDFIVTDGDGFGMVELVSGENYKILKTIKLPAGVDGAVFNPVNQYYYVESGGDETKGQSHKINIIDTKAFKLVGDITLPGNHSEAMAITRDGKKMYVNLSGPKEVGVVDLASGRLVARWPIAGAEVPNGMGLDEMTHRLFVATRTPPTFFAFDTDTGKIMAKVPISGFNDDLWFDATRKHIYLSGSDTTTVLAQNGPDTYIHVAEVPTGFRAKTSLYVPQLSRFYVAVSGKGKTDAQLAVKVYDVQP
ncbi:MAG: hypothetical protein LAO19_11845 [Acidobacteriia bacterium]|nr:hypothetical protein [Terriglobia bacterium]